jgi:hypothetical protein
MPFTYMKRLDRLLAYSSGDTIYINKFMCKDFKTYRFIAWSGEEACLLPTTSRI